MVYKDFSNMAVHHFGDLPFVWKFKDRYLRMVSYWFRTLLTKFIRLHLSMYSLISNGKGLIFKDPATIIAPM